jgi:hypothetical protein
MRHHRVFRRHASVSCRHLSVGERTAGFLRSIHPEKTAANVSADTRGRISAKTIEKMLERLSAPSTVNGIILFEVYGPEFMCALMDNPPEWLSAAGREQAAARLDAGIAELEALKRELQA